MRRGVSLLLVCLWLLGNSSATDQPIDVSRLKEPISPLESGCYVPNQIIVKFSNHRSSDQIWIAALNRSAQRVENIDHLLWQHGQQISRAWYHQSSGYYVIETKKNCDLIDFQNQLLSDPMIAKVSLNYVARISDIIPDDPLFKNQYSLGNQGQIFSQSEGLQGTAGCDIKASQGWQWSTGSQDMIIAVVDTGIADRHEDLEGKVIPGYNFIDDDFNAYDDHGHGTFVASIIAAATNNGKGIAGVCWQAKILPIKVMNSNGHGDYLTIAAGIDYAVAQGAKVINLSLGRGFKSFTIEEKCQMAYEQGCVIVAASGNSPLINLGDNVEYPAAYDPYCLAVGASDAHDVIAPWSNYGPQVDVSAPGVCILGAHFDPENPDQLNLYHEKSGTSAATALVSGAVALLLSNKPFLTNEQVMVLIRYTADDVNRSQYPGIDQYMGYGRINLRTLLGPLELD